MTNLLQSHPSTDASQPIAQELDICIDDQDGVYLKVPTKLFLSNCNPTTSEPTHHELLLNTVAHNKTISQRIYDASNDEMRWITQRLCNEMTKDDFQSRIMGNRDNKATQSVWKTVLQQDEKNSTSGGEHIDWTSCLLEAVEEYRFDDTEEILECVDLFVVEGIFKTPTRRVSMTEPTSSFVWPSYIANRPLSGLSAATLKLKYLAKEHEDQSVPLAWGNTNTVRYLCALFVLLIQ